MAPIIYDNNLKNHIALVICLPNVIINTSKGGNNWFFYIFFKSFLRYMITCWIHWHPQRSLTLKVTVSN